MAQRFFPPPESFRRNIVSVRLAPVFLFVLTEFLHRSPRRLIQLLVPFNPTRETLIILLDRFRSADESGMQFTPNGANHEYLAIIVAHARDSVQQGGRMLTRVNESNRLLSTLGENAVGLGQKD